MAVDLANAGKVADPVRMSAGTGSVSAVRGSSTQSKGNPVSAGGQDLPPGSKVREADVQKAVSHLKDHVQQVKRDLSFSVDKASGRFVIKVIDTSTKEVIRQIPAKVALALAHDLGKDVGVLLREQA